MIVVVDYDMGNVGSILNMLRKLGYEAKLSRLREDIEDASGLILPGVGAFDQGMSNLKRLGLLELLNEFAVSKALPTLGICLGMQLLVDSSEEGMLPGLGWISGRAKRFSFADPQCRLRVPHMGWNEVRFRTRDIGEGLSDCFFVSTAAMQRFYFVHSYHVCCVSDADVLGTTTYGYEFASVIAKGNIFGTQFHPEKSLRSGMALLDAFGKYTYRVKTKGVE